MKKLLKPYIGQVLHLKELRILILQNLGISIYSVEKLLSLMSETQLIKEEEPFKFKVLGQENV